MSTKKIEKMRFIFLVVNVNIFIKIILLNFSIILPFSNIYAMTGKEINLKLKHWLSEKNIKSNPSFSDKKVFKKCKNGLNFDPVYKDFSLIQVRCQDLNSWKIFVRSNAKFANKFKNISKKKYYDAIKLKYSHEKNQIISKDSIYVGKSTFKNPFFTKTEELIGRKLKQNLKQGQIIKPRHLYQKFEINEGEPVIIKTVVRGISVTASGIAQMNGNLGDFMDVKNIRSGKIIKGFLKKNKIIEIFR